MFTLFLFLFLSKLLSLRRFWSFCLFSHNLRTGWITLYRLWGKKSIPTRVESVSIVEPYKLHCGVEMVQVTTYVMHVDFIIRAMDSTGLRSSQTRKFQIIEELDFHVPTVTLLRQPCGEEMLKVLQFVMLVDSITNCMVSIVRWQWRKMVSRLENEDRRILPHLPHPHLLFLLMARQFSLKHWTIQFPPNLSTKQFRHIKNHLQLMQFTVHAETNSPSHLKLERTVLMSQHTRYKSF